MHSQNLILNGGFEDENTCTEYNIECAPEAWITSGSGLSQYFKDASRSFAGEHCMAIVAGHYSRPYDRTFLRSPLVCLLKKGQRYRLALQIKSPHRILDSIGVYFGPIDPLLERKPIHQLAPSLYLSSGNTFARDSNWQRAVLDYTAKGDEAYITIANFSRNDLNGNTGIRRQYQFYAFIDEVSLVPLDSNEKLCENREKVREDIYAQNERHQFLQRILTFRNDSRNTNQERPQPTVLLKSDSFLLPDVLFAISDKDLRPESFVVLDSFCRNMTGKRIDSLIIDGHTDNTGTDAFNDRLSLGRAASVASYFKSCPVLSKVVIIVRGWGSKQPVAPNNTPAGRQQNRRVQLSLYFRE